VAQPAARLLSLGVKAYGSLKDARFDPNKGLSVLIGKNSSGNCLLKGICLTTIALSDKTFRHVQR
jgi:recombinational DNA repair ATPase RecF